MPLRNRRRPAALLEDAERLPRVGELEVDQDIGFQRAVWRAQRVG